MNINYTCKQCQIVTQQSHDTPTTTESRTPNKSIAATILSEECDNDKLSCVTCNKPIQGTAEICDICQHQSHISCIGHGLDGRILCTGCKGFESQTQDLESILSPPQWTDILTLRNSDGETPPLNNQDMRQ